MQSQLCFKGQRFYMFGYFEPPKSVSSCCWLRQYLLLHSHMQSQLCSKGQRPYMFGYF